MGDHNRHVVVAKVDDAAKFCEAFEGAPADVAADFILCKAPTEDIVEFFVNAGRDDTLTQFLEAANFLGQSFHDVTVNEA